MGLRDPAVFFRVLQVVFCTHLLQGVRLLVANARTTAQRESRNDNKVPHAKYSLQELCQGEIVRIWGEMRRTGARYFSAARDFSRSISNGAGTRRDDRAGIVAGDRAPKLPSLRQYIADRGRFAGKRVFQCALELCQGFSLFRCHRVEKVAELDRALGQARNWLFRVNCLIESANERAKLLCHDILLMEGGTRHARRSSY